MKADGIGEGPLPLEGRAMDKTCGSCRWCSQFEESRGVLYDPHSEVDEPLRTGLRLWVGICEQPDQPPNNVMLDSRCGLCDGDGWEPRD